MRGIVAIATQRITVALGQTVTWTNKESVAHTVTKDRCIAPPYHDLTNEALMAHLANGAQNERICHEGQSRRRGAG